MSRQLKGILYFFMIDARFSMMIFWTIMAGVLLLSVVSAAAFFGDQDQETTINFALSPSVYIFSAIFGFVTVKESIPFSIKMGAVRKNYFIAAGVFFLGFAILLGLITNIVHSFVLWLTGILNTQSFSFSHLAMLVENTWINRFIIDVSIMFFLFTAFYLLSLFFYRFGLKGGGVVAAILFFLVVIGTARGWLIDGVIHVFRSENLIFYGQLFLTGIILYAISYILLRKITVVKAK